VTKYIIKLSGADGGGGGGGATKTLLN